MKGNLRAPIWIIPVLVLVMAIGAFAAVVALNHSTAPLAEADIAVDPRVTVELTDKDVGELSGYTITATVEGVTGVTVGNMITVTFPAGTTAPEMLNEANGITMGDGGATDPAAVTAITVVPRDDELEKLVVMLTVPMGIDIDAGALLIVFPEEAGIINPKDDTESDDTVSVFHDDGDANAVLSMSADITYTGKNRVRQGTATVFPDDPGDPSRLRVDFKTSPSGDLKPGDEIILTLEDDFGFELVTPMVLSLITVSADAVTAPATKGSCEKRRGPCQRDTKPHWGQRGLYRRRERPGADNRERAGHEQRR